MQGAFGPHKSTKLFKKLFLFDEFLSSTNFVSNRYFYPVYPVQAEPSISPNPDYKIQWPRQGGAGLSLPRSSRRMECLRGQIF
jgi:hypothetical protein